MSAHPLEPSHKLEQFSPVAPRPKGRETREDVIIGLVVRCMFRATPTQERVDAWHELASRLEAVGRAARDLAFEMLTCRCVGQHCGRGRWPTYEELDKARRRAFALQHPSLRVAYEIVRETVRELVPTIPPVLLDKKAIECVQWTSEDLERQQVYGTRDSWLLDFGSAFMVAADQVQHLNQSAQRDLDAAKAARRGTTGRLPNTAEADMVRDAVAAGIGMTELARAVVDLKNAKRAPQERRDLAVQQAERLQKIANRLRATDGRRTKATKGS